MPRGNHIRKAINPINKHARKEEVRKNDDPLKAELRHMFQAGLNKGKRNAGKAGFNPPKLRLGANLAGHSGNIRIRIGVTRAPANDDKACFLSGYLFADLILLGKRLFDPSRRGSDHIRINTEFPSISDLKVKLARVGV